jgi:hypothetical protein
MSRQAPFLDVASFARSEAETPATHPQLPPISPFLGVYDVGENGNVSEPRRDAQTAFLNELYDDGLEEALFALAREASLLSEPVFSREADGAWHDGDEAERVLTRHFEPLVSEVDRMLDALAQEFSRQELHSLTADEIGRAVDEYHSTQNLPPEFEEFLGKIKNVVKKATSAAVGLAKQGVSAAARVGLGPILEKLKGLVRPLLQRVIQSAIGRLPAPLQPHARALASRLPMLGEVDGSDDQAHDAETCAMAQAQYEFNHRVANLIFASDSTGQDLEYARASATAHRAGSYPILELDRARARFVNRIRQLSEGEDPTPHVEEFVPAILPVLKTGITLVGRKRVVDYLAGLVGRMIQRFVGPQHSAALSQAIVDAGLRMIQLEASEDDADEAAAASIAAVVEETVRRVADLPDYVLEEQTLFEGFALQAFEQAAAANLPAILPDATYRNRPDLAEARSLGGTWIPMPRGPRKRFKKYSRPVPVRVSPRMVEGIESFEGIPLEEYLEEELGVVTGEEVDAVVHLYESLPGTSLVDIARLDDAPSGLGTPDAYDQLHPLTTAAAGVLLGMPELGRDVDPRYLVDEHTTSVGQRFYFLEVPGRRPLTTAHAPGRSTKRRPTQLRLVFDFSRNEARVRLFLSEVRSQHIAVKLRQRSHAGSLAAYLSRYIDRGLRSSLSGAFARLKLIHETVTPDQWVAALGRLPTGVRQRLSSRMLEWTLTALVEFMRQQPEEFIRAADDPTDGVTLVVSIASPPGFAALRHGLAGKSLSLDQLRFPGAPSEVTVRALPGHVDE